MCNGIERIPQVFVPQARALADCHRACALQGVVAMPWILMSSDLTVPRLPENSHLSKPLNQRDSSNPERILLLMRYKNVRMTQTRLRDSNEIDCP